MRHAAAASPDSNRVRAEGHGEGNGKSHLGARDAPQLLRTTPAEADELDSGLAVIDNEQDPPVRSLRDGAKRHAKRASRARRQ